MTLIDILTSEIDTLLGIEWDQSDGKMIPEGEDVVLNEAAKIEATFLYADLAGSSILAQKCPWETTAKIIRAYLTTAVRLIEAHGGEIRSFNGDRVMGIFRGETPNTTAVNCARKIDWMVEKVINPKAEAAFSSIRKNKIKIKHCIGIDTSEAWAVCSGISSSNDLIWIGKAPGFAAKLSKIRKYPYSVYISRDCFIRLGNIAKEAGEENIWFEKTFKFGEETHTVYRTNGMLRP
jgi:class 3 adenylate cyclase